MRFYEIDLLRGIAICLMIFYHLLFDLYFFYSVNFITEFVNWRFVQVITGSLFLTLVGISLTLKAQRLEKNKVSLTFQPFFVRSLKLFVLAFFLSTIINIFVTGGLIIFGILHLIALSLILTYPFLKRPFVSLLGSITIFFSSIFFTFLLDNRNLLIPLGGRHPQISMIDYYPLFPWLAFVLLGISLGNFFYRNYSPKFALPNIQQNIIFKFLSFLGRHSLLIYFVHQPILLLVLRIFL